MSNEQHDEQAERRRRRADAAAERARHRAMRPWYQRPWVIASAVVAVLVVIGALAGETTTGEPAAETAAADEKPASEPANPAGGSEDPPSGDTDTDAEARSEAAAGNPDPLPVEDPRFQPDDNPPDEIPPPTVDDVLQIGEGAELLTDGTPSEIITVEDVEYSDTPYDEYGSGPRRKVFLIFTVRVDGLASTSVDEMDFYVVTRNGTRIDAGNGNSWDAVNYDDTLGFAEVNAGQHRTGYIVFDSPVRHGTLEYDPNFEGEPIVSWEF